MIYELHEMQHAAFVPLRMLAETSAVFYVNPFSQFLHSPHKGTVRAGTELLLRLTQRYEKPPFALSTTVIDGEEVAVNETVVMAKPFCRLLRFERQCARRDPAVLVIAPMSGHHATLLRETVRTLLPEHEVYITDWIDARLVPLGSGAFHLDDYVAYVQEFIRLLGPDLHVLAVCQPTVPVLAAVALMSAADEPAAPRSMVLMGGPIDTRLNPTSVNTFAKSKPLAWFESKLIQRVPFKYPGGSRRVYPGFLQHASFVAMNPDRHIDSHVEFYRHLVEGDEDGAETHRQFYDEYNAVMDLPAEYYLETVKTVFQDHALARGELMINGIRVDPSAIRHTALLTIEGELDDICGRGQTEAAHDLCLNLPKRKRAHLVADGAGHYGIFSGRRFRENIYPRIRAFIRAHTTQTSR